MKPLLEVINLMKSFGALEATRNLSLSVEQGSLHALIGPNGAGKTTFVNQLSGDLIADDGSIIFDGHDITRLPSYSRSGLGLARSYQITSLFEELTVGENMALAILAHTSHNFMFWRRSMSAAVVRRNLAASLDYVGLLERKDETASHLSHGEKRQLEVGMTLVGKPKLLILDEPMAGMGPGGTVELSKRIENLKGKLTILLVEHDMNVVFSLADRVSVLVNGHNVATGTPDEIRANPLVRSAYLGE
ncbi:ABC transporter ATP-binding protein [Desulfopila sp. IMCC35008]|uniref:ABC transporter ATP-binding protein n=1 Tax=Desulfopila sp. IMCC35008 TaxID=2653858 RepID=UPI0013D10963|nr:ABC transporter ATP-binding protein [Desulfopila sp. IMCC35008]